MIKLATSVLDGISKWVTDNPTAASALLAGGAGALGGYAITKSDPDETVGAAIKRRLKNALIVGGLAAGAGALSSEAVKAFGTAMPAPKPPSAMKRIGGTAGVATAGAGAGALVGRKVRNSEITWLGGEGATKRNLAQALDPRYDGKSIARAEDIIRKTLNSPNGLEAVAKAQNLMTPGVAEDTRLVLARILDNTFTGDAAAAEDVIKQVLDQKNGKKLLETAKQIAGLRPKAGPVLDATTASALTKDLNRIGFKVKGMANLPIWKNPRFWRGKALPAAAGAGLLGWLYNKFAL